MSRCYKTFFVVADKEAEYTRTYVYSKSFQPSLIVGSNTYILNQTLKTVHCKRSSLFGRYVSDRNKVLQPWHQEGLYEGPSHSVLVTDYLGGGDLVERVSRYFHSTFILA